MSRTMRIICMSTPVAMCDDVDHRGRGEGDCGGFQGAASEGGAGFMIGEGIIQFCILK